MLMIRFSKKVYYLQIPGFQTVHLFGEHSAEKISCSAESGTKKSFITSGADCGDNTLMLMIKLSKKVYCLRIPGFQTVHLFGEHSNLSLRL